MPTIGAVIFDIDDTLYPERDYVYSGYRAVVDAFADQLGASLGLYARMCTLYATPDRPRVFNVIVAEAGVTGPDAERLVTAMIDKYRVHTPTIELYPDARQILGELRGRVRLGVISDGYLITQKRKVAALNLPAMADEIILTDAWGRQFWKPHPRAFEEMARRLNVDHAACAYVSDNLGKDFVAPNALGWTTVLVDRPDRVHAAAAAPAGGEPHHTICSLAELASVLGFTASR
jgi:putative hydrolase of the HAD superfamily